ncbi:glycosyl hydrolase 115 family protein [Mucilaginibacter sp. PAMB04274]|uniref:glycosyl hydrolase 115 family protein n=1 Tax=Mucilaginibacter sp. PAMB04274 TaxID=3138568 RepID=UPI0031F65095
MNKISRKNFIKNCSATLGLLSVGLPDVLGAPKAKQIPFYTGNKEQGNNSTKTRGSWVRVGQSAAGDVKLSNCVIVVNNKEHTAVRQAAQFLTDDIAKISGYKPPILSQKDESKVNVILSTFGSGSLPSQISSSKLKGKKEAYQIVTHNNEVWLIGADFRGTAYAAYHLSERLGIDPLYLWTGYQALKNTNLTLKSTNHYEAPPTVKYRGFFHDDEDVLPRPFDRYGFPLRIGDVPLKWYQNFFETALRLRMNMVAPYVRVHRRYEVQKCASDWGLYFTSHHYDILLSNPFGIERFKLAERRGVNTDWDWFKSKDNMIRYWRGGVEENKGVNAIWPVGLRGTDDHAYEFPKDTTEKEQAEVFREAIDAQVKIVRELAPANDPPAFHFTLYTEMLEKYKKHPEDFNVPDDVILVWPDNNDGVMRDLPSGTDKWKHGVYYHLAYYGGPPTKQGTHVVTPERVAEQFKRIVDAGATEFMLVNVSELREHVMEGRMIADICWNAAAVLNKPEPHKAYLKWWIDEYFASTTDSQSIMHCYDQYYALINGSDKTYFGAVQFESVLELLHKRFTHQTYNQPDQVKVNELRRRNAQYESVINTINTLLPTLNREEKQFFFEHVEFGLRVDQRPTQAALMLLNALHEPDENKAWNIIAEAAVPLEKLEVEILRAERPPFDKWYIPTWIKTPAAPFNIHRSYTQIREFISCNGTQTPINPKPNLGHNIEGAKLWTEYLEASDRIKATY